MGSKLAPGAEELSRHTTDRKPNLRFMGMEL
jgi:hypothetical protein